MPFRDLPAGSVLLYGQTSTVGGFSCPSATAGVTCRRPANGAGFFLSRQRLTILAKVHSPGGEGSSGGGGGNCNPNYRPCIPMTRPDWDCSELSGTYAVVGADVYRLDRDGDGVACESA